MFTQALYSTTPDVNTREAIKGAIELLITTGFIDQLVKINEVAVLNVVRAGAAESGVAQMQLWLMDQIKRDFREILAVPTQERRESDTAAVAGGGITTAH